MVWYANPIKFIDPSGLSKTRADEVARYAKETSMSQLTTNEAITIVETDTEIRVMIYVAITGPMADLPFQGEGSDGKTTYRGAVVEGIETYWNGEYKGKKVQFDIVDLNDGRNHVVKEGQKVIEIKIDLIGRSGKVVGKNLIYMYAGDKYEPSHNYKTFLENSVHEIGHELGIADAYTDSGYGEKYSAKFKSLMNIPKDVDHAQDMDYAMMLRANKAGREHLQLYSKYYSATGTPIVYGN